MRYLWSGRYLAGKQSCMCGRCWGGVGMVLMHCAGIVDMGWAGVGCHAACGVAESVLGVVVGATCCPELTKVLEERL